MIDKTITWWYYRNIVFKDSNYLLSLAESESLAAIKRKDRAGCLFWVQIEYFIKRGK